MNDVELIEEVAAMIHLDFPDRKDWNGVCFDDMPNEYKEKLTKTAAHIIAEVREHSI